MNQHQKYVFPITSYPRYLIKCRLEKPCHGVFAQLLHFLNASILVREISHLETYTKHTWLRSQAMLIFVIFKAASKMLSAL